MIVIPEDVQRCKKCSRCKEIQGLSQFRNDNTSSWCRTCANEYARRYRKTKRYREVMARWLEKPGVRESRRQSSKKSRRDHQWWKTPVGKLSNARSLARYRLKQYERSGNEAAAQRQRVRIEVITAEIQRVVGLGQ